jgi:hypothetical protein
MADGTVYTTNASGQLVSVTSIVHTPGQPDVTTTTTYTDWDPVTKQPIEGYGPNGHFTQAYAGGNTIITLDNGTVTTMNAAGQLASVTVTQPSPTPGEPPVVSTTTFTAWDGENRPIAGFDADGTFTISHDPKTGYETVTYTDGIAKGQITVLTGSGKLVSTTLADGTFIDWNVELGELGRAAAELPRHVEMIAAANGEIGKMFTSVYGDWSSPAAGTFQALAVEFGRSALNLQNLLQESARRMQQSYQNIVDAETINASNTPPTTP